MATQLTYAIACPQKVIAGATQVNQIKVWDQQDTTTNLSAATATIAVYNSAGTATQSSGAATVSGTTVLTVYRDWATSGVTPGLYRVLVTVTYDSDTYVFSFYVRVDASPPPV